MEGDITILTNEDFVPVCPFRTVQVNTQMQIDNQPAMKQETQFPDCYKNRCPFWSGSSCIRVDM